jgi:hypothetical protein
MCDTDTSAVDVAACWLRGCWLASQPMGSDRTAAAQELLHLLQSACWRAHHHTPSFLSPFKRLWLLDALSAGQEVHGSSV